MAGQEIVGNVAAQAGASGQDHNQPAIQTQDPNLRALLPQVDPNPPILQLTLEQREIQELRRQLYEERQEKEVFRRTALQSTNPTMQIAMNPIFVPNPTEAGTSKYRADKGKGVMPSTSNPQPRLQRIQSVIESKQGHISHQDRYVPQPTPVDDADYQEDDDDEDQGEYNDEFAHDDRYPEEHEREVATTPRTLRQQKTLVDPKLTRQYNRNKQLAKRKGQQMKTHVPYNVNAFLGHQSARTPRYGSDGYSSSTPLYQEDPEDFDDEEIEDEGAPQSNNKDWFPPAQLPQNQELEQRVLWRKNNLYAGNQCVNQDTRRNNRMQHQHQ